MTKFQQILDKNRNNYRPLPFWSWNDKLDGDELKNQINWMNDNGIGGFFMHARGGLKTKYLSKEWFDLVEECCTEANKLGMDAWAYDENGWPSGFVGGKLLEKEENRDRYIVFEKGEFDENADANYIVDEERLVRIFEKMDGETYNLYIRVSVSTVDILNPEVVDQFLEATHCQYRERFGDDFAENVKGFFTDEPQYYRWGNPYTPMIEKYFREEYDEDIFDKLGLLFVKKDGYREFRYRYWCGMQKLMLQNWAQRVYGWCDDNGVRLTGHYIEETSLGMQMMCCGGLMPFYEYEHIPGIDWLTTMTNHDLPGRQVGSVAAQLGKKQVLTESFGICGWNVTPTTLRRILGMQYVNGVNLLCHHLMPYSEHGQRKTDYPAHYQKINPWVKEHFKEFNDYFTNLGCILAEGKEDVKVAMLHPIRSAYFEYDRTDVENTGEITGLDAELRNSCRQLSSRGISYHFIDETLLEKHGFVNNDAIGCGKCEYQYLVLPKIYTMGKNTERLISEFVANGGRVLLMDEAPEYLEGQPFAYDYLKSNCTLEDIVHAQQFKIKNTDNDLYYAFRQVGNKEILFVQNASVTEGFEQTFDFGKDVHSLVAINPENLETKKLPLTIKFEKEEAMLLMPSKEVIEEDTQLTEYELFMDNALVEFENNYLTVDAVKYSKDGITYSEPMLTSEVFKKMLQERYEGQIWLKYNFEIREMPEKLSLIVESPKGKQHVVNEQEIVFDEKWEDEHSFGITDISDKVHVGKNEYVVVMDWFQTDQTYYALFGEGVTESLKNCIAYDSEIEPIYLSGKFGVYSDYELEVENPGELIGRDFYIGITPSKVTDPIREGLTFFRGKLAITQKIDLENTDVILRIPGDYLMATVYVNGHKVAEMMFEKKVDISECAIIGENTVRVEFIIGNRNMFGPFHVARYGAFDEPRAFEESTLSKSIDGQYRYKFKSFY